MELQFGSRQLDCLQCVLREVQNSEQTQELKLGDGMPDVGRVISAWGQPIMRGKEWHSSEITFSGGMMVWVLYAAEGEAQTRMLSTWIPFSLRWGLPGGVPDGQIRISCLARFVDARSVSPRKIMVRCSMAVLAEAYIPEQISVFAPDTDTGEAELLKNSVSLRMPKQAGEKTFLLDEEVPLPESAPIPQKLVYCTVEPKLMESRVLSDKLVFRGVGRLHMLYESDGGQLHSWDFEMPFSQLAELGSTYSTEAQGDIRLAVTGLEPELQEDGKLRLKCGVAGQYLISDREIAGIVEDAYSVDWDLECSQTDLRVPVILETAKQNLDCRQTLQMEAASTIDVRFLPDFPMQRRGEQGMEVTYPGTFQVLSYGNDGFLHGSSVRWEGQEVLPVPESGGLMLYPQPPETSAGMGNGSMNLKAEVPVERFVDGWQVFPMVTDIQPGQEKKKDPGRPSLILERAGDSLWELAKRSGSTVDAIRDANHLESEPIPEKMLLIPIL